MTGVVRVLTADDVPGVNDAGVKHDEPLFPDEVMFVGHAVCWVLAETLEAARLGAPAVEVDYEPLPAIVALTEAIDAESFQGGQPVVARGDVEQGLAAATHVFSGVTEMAGQEHFYLETHASLALVDEGGQVFVQSSTQHPTETQEIVAHVLGRGATHVTVQCLRMGGGFGGKEMQPHGFAAIAALGAILTGRPVRLRLSRTHDMTMTGKRHGFHAQWRVGFDDDGRLAPLEATLTSDGGWSLDLSEPVLARALCHVDNAYWIPHVLLHGRVARTHKTSQTAFRGFGGPQGMLVIEDVLGRCAPLLGIDPVDLRRRNFYVDGQATPYGQVVRHPERVAAAWDQVLDDRRGRAPARGDRGLQRRPRPHQARARGDPAEVRHLLQLHRLQPGRRAGARLQGRLGADQPRRHRDGPGPAHQDAAGRRDHASGSRWSSVRLAPTRTDKVPNTSATAASSSADLNGGAVKDACDQITARLREVDAGRDLPWDDLVREAYFGRVQLWAAGFYRTEGIHWDSTGMTGHPFKYFAYGVAAAEVEVDGFTGAHRTRRVDIVHDVGDSLSPLVDIGQIEGGFVQGVGWLTLEDLRWDESDGPGRGRLTTQSASTYKLPSIGELPDELHVALLEHAHEDGVVYGSKAVGEPPLMLAFAVREALREAAAAFGAGRHQRPARVPGHAGGGLLGGGDRPPVGLGPGGRGPARAWPRTRPDPAAPALHPTSEQVADPAGSA